jgi:DNA-binding HxlR family transcriptional regulator
MTFPRGNWSREMSLKVRKNRSLPPPETCALTECMMVIAGAWAPNVIWHLREGPRRFSELRIDIPPVSAKVLSVRLRELEARGVVRRTIQPTSPPSVEYSLTPMGLELIPALDAIVQVGHKLKTGLGEQGKGITRVTLIKGPANIRTRGIRKRSTGQRVLSRAGLGS